ncbi:MFS transporter [Actinomyces vulturis]|uniref:MFS transporter n=1 Tax=Actinomyces vulturis TaxID=1857645 RepID=UPI000831DAE0|nr:MFS transporter [Actinomyces vulturis]
MATALTSARSQSSTPERPSLMTMLRTEGSDAFLITAFAGRLPASMVQLGLLMVVNAAGRGMGLAGATVAAVGIGSAVGAPIIGRSVDALGPWRVVASAMIIQITAMMAFTIGIIMGADPAVLLASAGVIGAANPQVGSIARSRWSALGRAHSDPRKGAELLKGALGYETAADELGFVIGPVGAGLLVSLLGGTVAMGTFIVLALLGEGAFALYLRRIENQAAQRSDIDAVEIEADLALPSTVVEKIPVRFLMPLALAVVAVGCVFGSTQTALTALNSVRHAEAMTGPVYGCVGIGSGVAGIICSRWHRSNATKIALGGALVLVASGLMVMTPPTLAQVPVALLLGLGVGTVLVTSYQGAEHVSPPALMTTVMTLLATCLVLGVSGGAAISGVLSPELESMNNVAVISHAAVARPFWPPVICGFVIITISMVIGGQRALRRRLPQSK